MCSDWAGFAEVRLGWAKLAKFMLASKKISEFLKNFFPNIFLFRKFLRNSLSPLKIGNMHIQVENQFFIQVMETMGYVPMVQPSTWPLQFDLFST